MRGGKNHATEAETRPRGTLKNDRDCKEARTATKKTSAKKRACLCDARTATHCRKKNIQAIAKDGSGTG
jgi:hypothetical protein